MRETKARAHTIKCESCSASIEITSIVSQVTCNYCGHTQVLDPQMLRELAAYATEVKNEASAAQEARNLAAAWDKTAYSMSQGRQWKSAALIIGPILAVVAVGIVLLQKKIIPPEFAVYFGPVIMGVLAIGFIINIIRQYGGKKKAVASNVAAQTVKCPNCGASTEVPPGQSVKTCAHCHAALFPSQTAQRKAMDAAALDRRRALMERYRAERKGMTAIARVGLSGTGLAFFVMGPMILMTGGAAVGFSYSMAQGEEPYSPAIFVVWAMFLGLIGGLVGFIKFRSSRKNRLASELGELAKSFGGGLLDSKTGEMEWLNTFWAGPFEMARLAHGDYYQNAQLAIGGYNLFIHLDPVAASKYHKASLLLLLSCETTGILNENAAINEIKERLKAEGFDIKIEKAGLVAQAESKQIKIAFKKGGSDNLRAPLVLMVELAKELGVTPVSALP